MVKTISETVFPYLRRRKDRSLRYTFALALSYVSEYAEIPAYVYANGKTDDCVVLKGIGCRQVS
jgi:hypothetical protein